MQNRNHIIAINCMASKVEHSTYSVSLSYELITFSLSSGSSESSDYLVSFEVSQPTSAGNADLEARVHQASKQIAAASLNEAEPSIR